MNRRSFLWAYGGPGLDRGLPIGCIRSFCRTDPGFRLVDVTAQAGIRFRHNSGAYGGKLLPETLGSGCAFLDYDRDGWQDILLVNGSDWPGHQDRASAAR